MAADRKLVSPKTCCRACCRDGSQLRMGRPVGLWGLLLINDTALELFLLLSQSCSLMRNCCLASSSCRLQRAG